MGSEFCEEDGADVDLNVFCIMFCFEYRNFLETSDIICDGADHYVRLQFEQHRLIFS